MGKVTLIILFLVNQLKNKGTNEDEIEREQREKPRYEKDCNFSKD